MAAFDITSLFGKPLPYKTTLKDFLKFLAVVEEGVIERYEVPHQKTFYDFKELIQDLNRCAITGSAVLEHRLGKEPKANDLDFFIDGTPENKKIIEEFFNYDRYKPIFEIFQAQYLPKPEIPLTYPKGYYENTVYDEYSFIKYDIKMSTSRFLFTHMEQGGFRLNFIFVVRLTQTERALLQQTERVHPRLYQDYFISENEKHPITKEEIFILTDSRLKSEDIVYETKEFQETTKILEIFPMGVPVHHIHATFDFEELKYVYSFEVQQAISTYIAGKILLESFEKQIKNREDTLTKERILKRIDNQKRRLSDLNESFVLDTTDPDTMTLSGGGLSPNTLGHLKRFNDSHIAYNRGLEEIFEGMSKKGTVELAENVMRGYHNLMTRIPKYVDRGMNISDPNKIIANIEYFMAMYSAYISSNQQLNQIAVKSCLLSGRKHDTMKAKAIKGWTKNLEQYRELNDIKLEPREVKHEQTVTIDAF